MTSIDLYALHRLSRTAADLGHYTTGKLINTAAAALVNRELYTEALPKTDQDFVAALEAIEPMLIAAGLDNRLIQSIRRARQNIADGRIVLYQDIPPVFVCRVCGEIAQPTVPDQCPHCGAGQLVFQSFPAAFYLEPEPVSIVMAHLAHTPDWLDHVLHGLSAEQVTRQVDSDEGAWSLLEAAGHLLDTQSLIAYRVSLFLENESPNLNAKAMWQKVESAKLSAAEIATNFRLSREAMLNQLRSAAPQHWTRVGQHSEFGPVTLQQQCTYFAKHEQWHMAQITHIGRMLAQS